MENDNLICIYDETKKDLNKIFLDIFAHFVENELENIDKI